MFEKTIAVLKEIRRRKNANKDRIRKQQAQLKDLLPFEAKLSSTMKIENMIFENEPDLDTITIEIDESSEALIDNYIQNELSDYIVKKHEDNPLLYDFKLKELEL